MKTTFEKVRFWIYLPMMSIAAMLGLYYILTAPQDMGFLRGVATALGLLPFGIFALGYHPRWAALRRWLPLLSVGVHLAGDVIFAFCHRIDRPFGISAWSYFRSGEFVLCMVGVIAGLLLLSRKSFAVGTGVMSSFWLMTFSESGAFRTATFALHLFYFGLLILFAWDSLPETDGLIRFFGWLFAKDAEIEEEESISMDTHFCRWPTWKYDALKEDEEDEDDLEGDY